MIAFRNATFVYPSSSHALLYQQYRMLQWFSSIQTTENSDFYYRFFFTTPKSYNYIRNKASVNSRNNYFDNTRKS